MKPVLVLYVLSVLFPSALLHAQTPFYQGKTVTIIVAAKAGDVYDLYPRLLAEFMPKYIPGNPNIIIQNVAGAAGLIGTNQLYNTAKPHGLTLGATYAALYFEQLVKRPEAKFDWSKLIWIGSPVSSSSLMYMRADTPYKSIEDINSLHTAKVRRHRSDIVGLLYAEAPGRRLRNQVRSGLRVRGGIGYRSRRRARRGSVPSVYDQCLLRP